MQPLSSMLYMCKFMMIEVKVKFKMAALLACIHKPKASPGGLITNETQHIIHQHDGKKAHILTFNQF